MNYQKIYNDLIKKAKSENRKKLKRDNPKYVYYEKHHILPKSMGGSDKKENTVLLTGREHFVCHKLLVEFLEGQNKHKMIFALHRLIFSKNNKYEVSSREYEKLRVIHSKTVGEVSKGRRHTQETKDKIAFINTGSVRSKESNTRRSNTLKNRVFSKETLEKMSIAQSGENNPMFGKFGNKNHFYGKVHSDKSLQKMKESHKNREKLECPHCGIICDISNATRWHFNNCKHKK